MDDLLGIIVLVVIIALISSSSKGKKKSTTAYRRNNPYQPLSKNNEGATPIKEVEATPPTKKQEDWLGKMEGILEKTFNGEMPFNPFSQGENSFYSADAKKRDTGPYHEIEEIKENKNILAEEGKIITGQGYHCAKEQRVALVKGTLQKEKKQKGNNQKKGEVYNQTPQGQPLVFSNNPITQGLIMGEILTRPCDRKRSRL